MSVQVVTTLPIDSLGQTGSRISAVEQGPAAKTAVTLPDGGDATESTVQLGGVQRQRLLAWSAAPGGRPGHTTRRDKS